MKRCGIMGKKVSTFLYIDRRVPKTVRDAGLNVSKAAENRLVEAVRRLRGPNPETGSFGELIF